VSAATHRWVLIAMGMTWCDTAALPCRHASWHCRRRQQQEQQPQLTRLACVPVHIRRRARRLCAVASEEQQYDVEGNPIGPGEVGIMDEDLYTTHIDALDEKSGVRSLSAGWPLLWRCRCIAQSASRLPCGLLSSGFCPKGNRLLASA
jgi:hypothetical protein